MNEQNHKILPNINKRENVQIQAAVAWLYSVVLAVSITSITISKKGKLLRKHSLLLNSDYIIIQILKVKLKWNIFAATGHC